MSTQLKNKPAKKVVKKVPHLKVLKQPKVQPKIHHRVGVYKFAEPKHKAVAINLTKTATDWMEHGPLTTRRLSDIIETLARDPQKRDVEHTLSLIIKKYNIK